MMWGIRCRVRENLYGITKKCLLSFLCVFFLFGGSLFGKNYFHLEKRPDIKIKSSLLYPTQPSLKNETLSLSNIVAFDFSSIDADVGFRISTDSSDTVLNFLITPLKNDGFELGAGLGYHFYDYFKVFTEQDIIFNSQVAFLKKDIFRFQINLGTFLKATFFRNNIITNNLWKPTAFIGFSFLWNINEHFKWYFSMSSIDYYDYSFLGTPFFKTGLDVIFSKRLSFGLDYTVKLIDMFAVAENISEMILGLYVRTRF